MVPFSSYATSLNHTTVLLESDNNFDIGVIGPCPQGMSVMGWWDRVVICSNAEAQTVNQIRGLDHTELVEVTAEAIAPAQLCSHELAHIFGDLEVCTKAHHDELHLTAFMDLLASVDQAQSDNWVRSLVELNSEEYHSQQTHILKLNEATLLIAGGKIEFTINLGICRFHYCYEW